LLKVNVALRGLFVMKIL